MLWPAGTTWRGPVEASWDYLWGLSVRNPKPSHECVASPGGRRRRIRAHGVADGQRRPNMARPGDFWELRCLESERSRRSP
eukprot:2340185-Pyramimonas_sp.AAC.1